MLTHRPATQRGHLNYGWLDTWHSFSFGSYYDPEQMGHSVLRVINEDRIAPHSGFDTHGHRNMEILTCMLQGTLSHRDNMGHRSTLHAGEWQMLSAGNGITHSEFNHGDEPVHLLQIWLHPEHPGTEPFYRQREFPLHEGLQLIASPQGREQSFPLGQQACVYQGYLSPGNHELPERSGRHAWLQLISGQLHTGDLTLQAGDGLALSDCSVPSLQVLSQAHFIFFDLP